MGSLFEDIFGQKPHSCATQGHQFEPRYSRGPSTMTAEQLCEIIEEMDQYPDSVDLANIISSQAPQEYVHDICTRCGEIRKS